MVIIDILRLLHPVTAKQHSSQTHQDYSPRQTMFQAMKHNKFERMKIVHALRQQKRSWKNSWYGMWILGEAVHMGGRGVSELSVLFAQLCCEPKTAIKKIKFKK